MATTEVIKQRKAEEEGFKAKMFDIENRARNGEEVGKKVGNGYIVEIDGKYNFINSHKRIITKNVWYNSLKKLNEHYILANADDRCNIYDIRTAEFILYGEKSGKPAWLNGCDTEFKDGLLRIQWKNGNWDYLNNYGYTLFSPMKGIKEATPFKDGEARIKLEDGEEAIINKRGEVIKGNDIWDYEEENDIVDDIVNEVMRRIKNKLY